MQDLMDYRRTLCRALPGLPDDEWRAAVRHINRIDRRLRAARKITITISFSPDEAPETADILEGMARGIRQGARR
jgi:nicotinamidase-related amidase